MVNNQGEKLELLADCISPNPKLKRSSKEIIFSVKRVPNIKNIRNVENAIKDN